MAKSKTNPYLDNFKLMNIEHSKLTEELRAFENRKWTPELSKELEELIKRSHSFSASAEVFDEDILPKQMVGKLVSIKRVWFKWCTKYSFKSEEGKDFAIIVNGIKFKKIKDSGELKININYE